MPVKPDARILEDIARMAGGAVNIFSGFREQMQNDIKARIEEMASRLDLVPREDFDRLTARVESLEEKVKNLSAAEQPAKAAKAKTKRPTAGQKPKATGKKQ